MTKKYRPLIAIFLLLSAVVVAVAVGQAQQRFDPSGSYWIAGEPPADFSDFSGINLNMRQLRRLPTSGVQLNDGTNFRFSTITVKQSNFAFTTAARRGIYYTFSGKFLKGGDFAATWTGDEEAVLEGTLAKFKGGKKVAEAKLKFIYFGGT